MLTNPKFAFVITILFLALSSCGSLESAKVAPKKTTSSISSTASTAQLSQLSTACLSAGGRMTSDGTTCLTRITKELKPSESNPDLVINSTFYTGEFIVATAGSGSVDILYDGRLLSKIPARIQGNLGGLPQGRPLTFFANSATYKDVFVTVWTCYHPTISNRVVCHPSQIPQ